MLSQGWKTMAGSLVAACIVVLAGSLAHAQQRSGWRDRSTASPHAGWAVQLAAATEPVPLGSHWIGVLCRPADDVLRLHLKLKHGLVVDRVVPKSPAAKAGIQQHDILLAVDGKELKTVVDLVRSVREAAANEMEIRLVREGEELTLKVTPAKRPGEDFDPLDGSRFDHDTIRKWIEQYVPKELDPEKMPFRKYHFGPGIVVPDTFGKKAKLPENLSVTITRKGGEKAEITVKRDGETWTATEDNLDQLPKDVQPHVKRLLGGGVRLEFDINTSKSGQEHLKQLPQWNPPRRPMPVPRIEVRPGRQGEEIERLERRMRDQLEKMQKSMEEMQRKLDEIRGDDQEGQAEDAHV
jgi:membrane-associated protease RseP (regulator of RpoE activity)